MYQYVPAHHRGLTNENFDALFVDTTFDVMDWTAWCFRNFPLMLSISNQLPQWLRRKLLPGEAANIESFDVGIKSARFCVPMLKSLGDLSNCDRQPHTRTYLQAAYILGTIRGEDPAGAIDRRMYGDRIWWGHKLGKYASICYIHGC